MSTGAERRRVGPVGEMQRELARRIAGAAARAEQAGALPVGAARAAEALGEGHVEVPRDPGHGDLASSAALRLAGVCKTAPRAVAETLLAHLDLGGVPVERALVAGPGFVNFHLRPRWLNGVVARVREEGRAWGRSDIGRGVRVQVEFVSANPTGPLGVVNARAAAVGDTLAALLDAVGYEVEREYYINDAGGQLERLARSVEARWLELQGQPAEVPEGGYRGEYVREIARAFEEVHGAAARAMDPGERLNLMGRFAAESMVADHRRCLEDFGVRFDVWYSQAEHITDEVCRETVATLEAQGKVYRKDGAVWLRTTDFGDDKDRVLVTSQGRPTYFLADTAYHRDKYSRGFRHVIDLWGPDHHGYVPRMKAAVAALGYPADAFEVLIVQMVRLVEGGRLARMSKRRGQIVPMRELIAEVGVDAARFFFLLRSADSHLDFDVDLARLKTADSPVYYVQYAHARIASILRQPEAADLPAPGDPALAADLELLEDPAETGLIRRLADLPEEVAGAALAREPHRLTRYALDVATSFHKFYDTCRVLTEDPALRRARLALADATRIVLANVLGLLGVSAPERM